MLSYRKTNTQTFAYGKKCHVKEEGVNIVEKFVSDGVYIQREELRSIVHSLFVEVGMRPDEAAICTDNLIKANLWGIDSHGVIRVPLYVDRIVKGGINTAAEPKWYEMRRALTVLDADGMTGAVAGTMAMREAISRARECGIAAVGVRNSNHFGAAGYYSAMAVDAGMIGISMTNVTLLVAGEGSAGAIAGNNPFSIAVPTYSDTPFMLDMAVSRVANGKLILAEKMGRKIPMDWATDRNGEPTDDPCEAQKGFLLPMADYKGLIMAYAIDILCGLITGGKFADGVVSMYKHPELPSEVAHMMMAIDVSAMLGMDAIREKMATYKAFLKNAPMKRKGEQLLLPGEKEHNCMQQRLKDGIPVPLTTLKEIAKLCERYHVDDKIQEKCETLLLNYF